MVVSQKRGTPKSSIYRWIFHYKPTILGYLHFRKPPYTSLYIHVPKQLQWSAICSALSACDCEKLGSCLLRSARPLEPLPSSSLGAELLSREANMPPGDSTTKNDVSISGKGWKARLNYVQLCSTYLLKMVPNLASMPSTVFLFTAGKPKWSLQLVSRCFKMLWHSHSRFPNDHMFMVCSHIHLLYAAVPSLCNRTKLHTQRAG